MVNAQYGVNICHQASSSSSYCKAFRLTLFLNRNYTHSWINQVAWKGVTSFLNTKTLETQYKKATLPIYFVHIQLSAGKHAQRRPHFSIKYSYILVLWLGMHYITVEK